MFRLYSEHVPASAIDAPLLRALASRGVELALAVFPGDDPMQVVGRASAAGVKLVLWPMLDDEHGRWPSASNVESFREHVDALVRGLPAGTLLFDLEPPIAWTKAAVHWRYTPRPRASQRSHRSLAEDLRRRGWQVEAVVPPMLLYGARWERWLGTAVSELQCERVEPMAYTSLFEGYSKGLVPRRVARDLLVRLTQRATGGAVALGVVGGGALGDEPAYRDVAELREDVAIARAAGATRLSLYSLDGILARGDVDEWLGAFVETQPGQLPPPTRRGALLDAAARLFGG